MSLSSKIFCIALGLVLACPAYAFAACSWSDNTGTVASPFDHADVADCVTDAATKTGDVIIKIPSCTVTWDAAVTFDMSDVSDPAPNWTNVTSLTIQGAGAIPSVIGSDGLTNITNGGFTATLRAGIPLRFSNLTIAGTTNNATGFFTLQGTSEPTSGGFRIDHITSTHGASGKRDVYVNGYQLYGLIDAYDRTNNYQFAIVYGDYQKGGNRDWHNNISLGTAKAVYLENSRIISNAATESMVFDSGFGGRIVVRYSIIQNKYFGGHDASSLGRAAFSLEAYNNAISYTFKPTDSFSLRGGVQYVYGNAITNASGFGVAPITLTNYRSFDNGAVSPWTQACDGTSLKICLGTLNSPDHAVPCSTDADCSDEVGSCQEIDGGTGGNGYPCRDQIGRTKTAGGEQALFPSLFWANTLGGVATNPVVTGAGLTSTHIQLNTDYCQGVTKPSTCNSVETSYTAYTCPHPSADPGATGYCNAAVAGTSGYNLEAGGDPVPYAVTPSVASGSGTISPNVAEAVAAGGNSSTYTATPANGWKVTWSGTCGATGSAATYQKTNVTADCTIIATFSEIKLMPW